MNTADSQLTKESSFEVKFFKPPLQQATLYSLLGAGPLIGGELDSLVGMGGLRSSAARASGDGRVAKSRCSSIATTRKLAACLAKVIGEALDRILSESDRLGLGYGGNFLLLRSPTRQRIKTVLTQSYRLELGFEAAHVITSLSYGVQSLKLEVLLAATSVGNFLSL
jgi:hypothetical protein